MSKEKNPNPETKDTGSQQNNAQSDKPGSTTHVPKELAVVAPSSWNFQSRYLNYRINLRKPRYGLDAMGRHSVVDSGLVITFEQGRYTTDDAQIVNELRRLRTFGVDFQEINPVKVAEAANPAAASAA